MLIVGTVQETKFQWQINEGIRPKRYFLLGSVECINFYVNKFDEYHNERNYDPVCPEMIRCIKGHICCVIARPVEFDKLQKQDYKIFCNRITML